MAEIKKTGLYEEVVLFYVVSTGEFRTLQSKYSLDPLINDTEMAIYMLIDDLLDGYEDVQRSTVERLKASKGNKDPGTGFFRRKSEMAMLGLSSSTAKRSSKLDNILENRNSASLNLDPSIF
eukprot:NODE_624_length_5893_cov_0.149465.p4 type:complete len:122 gc:universal NODE_624_length_5893_cov_0.149465:2304-1939(-)